MRDDMAEKLMTDRYKAAAAEAKRRWDMIAKPIDSLGALEDYVVKLCAIAGSAAPPKLEKRALVIMCADHGVVAEGVTQTDSRVTRIVAENFARGCSSVNYMAQRADVDVFTVDIGMDTPEYPEKQIIKNAVIDRKIARGTRNLAQGPAMTAEQCRRALDVGIGIVGELKAQGYDIIATGEMGIGNTTPSSALAAAFLNLSADVVTGRGAGLSDEGLKKKRQVVGRALARVTAEHPAESQSIGRGSFEKSESLRLLAELGGYEIAGMAGMFLGGVKHAMPILIDGAISAVSALAAARFDRRISDYAIASHVSEEITGRLALQAMELEAVLHGRLCLGEGSGAVAVLPMMDMALNVYAHMGTFSDLHISAYDRAGKPEQRVRG